MVHWPLGQGQFISTLGLWSAYTSNSCCCSPRWRSVPGAWVLVLQWEDSGKESLQRRVTRGDRHCKSSGLWGERQLGQYQQALTPLLVGNNVKNVHLRSGLLNREGWFLQQMVLGKQGSNVQKNEIVPLSYTIPQN